MCNVSVKLYVIYLWWRMQDELSSVSLVRWQQGEQGCCWGAFRLFSVL